MSENDQAWFQQLAISENGLVFDPRTGARFSANESARFVLRALAQGLNKEQLLRRMQRRYRRALGELSRDLDVLLRRLHEVRLSEAA